MHFAASFFLSGPAAREYTIAGELQKRGAVAVNCYGLSPSTRMVNIKYFNSLNTSALLLSTDGLTLSRRAQEDCSTDFETRTETSSWSFKALREQIVELQTTAGTICVEAL